MGKIVGIYGKKLFSLALIFNALLTIAYAVGLLSAFYTLYPEWKPYTPYIIDGSLFWALIPAALVNIFPCVNIGKVETGRLWFHHYVYGFIVIGLATVLTAYWFPTSMPILFTGNLTTPGENIGRFFILGGLTLVIDDLPDVSKRIKSGLCALKFKAHKNARIVHTVQFLMGCVSLYFLAAITLYLPQHPPELTLANAIFFGTLIVTSLTSFANVRRRAWLNIKLEKTKSSEKSS